MTDRLKRRAAEMEVIEAARFVRHSMSQLIPAIRPRGSDRLAYALNALDALGLATPGRARVNANAPVTARVAAIWMNGDRARSLSAQIVRQMWFTYNRGSTVDELEWRLGASHQSVSPRVNELRDLGWIEASDWTRATRSGRQAIVWRLTLPAKRAIEEAVDHV